MLDDACASEVKYRTASGYVRFPRRDVLHYNLWNILPKGRGGAAMTAHMKRLKWPQILKYDFDIFGSIII